MIPDFYFTVGEIKTWFGVTKTILERGSEKWWGDESELICDPLQDSLKSSVIFLVTFIICQSWTGICRDACDSNPPPTLLAWKGSCVLAGWDLSVGSFHLGEDRALREDVQWERGHRQPQPSPAPWQPGLYRSAQGRLVFLLSAFMELMFWMSFQRFVRF